MIEVAHGRDEAAASAGERETVRRESGPAPMHTARDRVQSAHGLEDEHAVLLRLLSALDR